MSESKAPQDDPERNLIEEAASAYRPPSTDELAISSAWHDLSDEGRQRAFDLARLNRTLEATADPEGFDSTIHAVLQRIRNASS
ncbi:MAG: hypothetical protein CL920_04840 [Deltaproteobacteria bacterium]|nr:hypothetical protein [Deltaproteobacteria bacterium]|tara:strand:- start:10700 stop:10951 length:252 start_codon:yes stop_codon:yes gene_type:complete